MAEIDVASSRCTSRARVGVRRGCWVAASMSAACVAMLGVVVASSALAARLNPDLITRPFENLRLCREDPAMLEKQDACTGQGRKLLRFSNSVGNRGAGPLELRPDFTEEGARPDCHQDGKVDINGDGIPDDNDIWEDQAIYLDGNGNGRYDRSVDTAVFRHLAGCKYYHVAHHHYHLEGYAAYVLRSEQTGNVVSTSPKVSFCVADSVPFDLSLPGAPSSARYQGSSCGRTSVTGTSVGWADRYAWKLYGQSLPVGTLATGFYCLISTADPNGALLEQNTGNNGRQARLFIDPSTVPPATPFHSGNPSYRTISPEPGPCRLGS
jgi:hypothetical protein